MENNMNLQESIRNDLNKMNESTYPNGVSKVNEPSIDTNGTSFSDDVSVSIDTIVDLFGEPELMSFGKTDAEWNIEMDDGSVVTIYNWMNGENANGDEDGTPLELIYDWHLGGDVDSAKIIKSLLLNDGVTKGGDFEEITQEDVINFKSKEITDHQVEQWLGSDVSRKDIIEILRDIANGDYPAEMLKSDITRYE